MVNKYDILKWLEKKLEENPNYDIVYNKEDDTITYRKSNITLSFDDFFTKYKKKSGESFDCLYDEHVSCFSVCKCTECGTVVFYKYDEDYEEMFKCPVCTDYKTGYEYWTKEDIENDREKQKEIDFYVKLDDVDREFNKRYIKRGNKYDWQILTKKIIFKNKMFVFEFECNNITESYFKGLKLLVSIYHKDNDNDILFECKKTFEIPLSISAYKRKIKRRKTNV